MKDLIIYSSFNEVTKTTTSLYIPGESVMIGLVGIGLIVVGVMIVKLVKVNRQNKKLEKLLEESK